MSSVLSVVLVLLLVVLFVIVTRLPGLSRFT